MSTRAAAESGSAALTLVLFVLVVALSAHGVAAVAVVGAARARASAAADAAALAAALALGSGGSGPQDAAATLAGRNGAVLDGAPGVDEVAGEVSVRVAVRVDVPYAGARTVRAAATARLEAG